MRYVAIDIETVGLRPYGGTIWMLSYFDGKKQPKVYHDCFGKTAYFKEVKAILEDNTICKVIHSSEFDAPYIELTTGIRIRNIWDTRLCEQVIQGVNLPRLKTKTINPEVERMYQAHSSSLKYVAPRYGLPEPDKTVRTQFIDRPKGIPFTKEEIKYAAYDAQVLLPIQKAQEFLLTRDRLIEVALLENKTAEVTARMKVLGLGFSPAIWKKITLDNQYQYDTLINKLPRGINWNSPQQVKTYFKNRGVRLDSFDDLEKALLVSNDTQLRIFIEARDYATQISKYGLSWISPDVVDPDGRIRCSWEQVLNTGRFSVSNPPIHGLKKEGRHRSAFIPAKGKVFVVGDYTGQEIGIMAAAAKEQLWIDAMLRKEDVHALTASIVFKDQWAQGREKGCTFPQKCKCKMHKKFRHDAKTNNFMLAYGGGIEKFMAKTGHDKITAAQIIGRHNRAIPAVVRWLNRNAQQSLKEGVSYSADPYRRRRVLLEEQDWRIINQGKNNPVQSAGANMVKLAMISIPEEFPIVFVWHDEIILEVDKKVAVKAKKVLKEVMEKTANYITGIEGLIRVEPRIQNNLMKDED